MLCQRLYSVFISLIAILLITSIQTASAADYAREQRWADQALPGIIVGEPIYLSQKNQHRFLGLYAEAESSPMALIIAHGMGLHPDWGMIGTLRRDLNDLGYTTLSIQMPILAADASYKEYPALFSEAAERLQLAALYLQQKGYKKIVIISHSNGSRMTRVYMAQNPSVITAWVALSLTQGDTFAGINCPVLDLYGEKDLDHVLASVTKRKDSLQNPLSEQASIPDANHFFAGQEDKMIEKIYVYLNRIK